ncbi:MAG: hypothetical protein RIR26_186 [Pseudomonadota bacterium]
MWPIGTSRHGKSSATLDSGSTSTGELNRELVIRAGLNFERVRAHQERILNALNSGRETTLPIVGACTTSNGGVIPWKTLVRFAEGERLTAAQRRARRAAFHYWCRQHLGTFIPAAGAASRFMSSLQRFIQDVNQQVPELNECCRRWLSESITTEQSSNRSRRLDSLATLAAIPLPADIKVIPQLLGDWSKTQVFNEFSKLANAFEAFFTDGKEIESSGATLGRKWTHPENQDLAPESNYWRLHWDIETGTHPTTHGVVRGNKNEIHWLDALQSQPPVDTRHQNKRLRRDLSEKERLALRCYAAAFILSEKFSGHPKALVPTTAEGDSFLFLKLVEQIALLPSAVSIYVAPYQQTPEFKTEIEWCRQKLIRQAQNVFDLGGTQFAPDWLKPTSQRTGPDTNVLEQGLELCTLRFDERGTALVGEDGSYSAVAAGHGELLNLFSDISAQWPNLECLHIRNIDNVIGTQQERQQELSAVAETFRLLRDTLEFLRSEVEDFLPHCRSMNNDRLKNANALTALKFLGQLIPSSAQAQVFTGSLSGIDQGQGLGVEDIQRVLGNLFHWQPLPENLSTFAKWDWLQQQLARPLSVFGVVRKEVGDVGGGPVFAQLPDGTHVKICLEMPHASKEDAQEYFGNKGRATHFNPVLVFFELRTHQRSHSQNPRSGRIVQPGQLFDEHFWLLARKEFKGRKVCYHETVLYELIGNSARTNVLFVEVPRTLFKPHKTLLDSLGQDRRSYGFDETLKIEE